MANVQLIEQYVAPPNVFFAALAALQVLGGHVIESRDVQYLANLLVQATRCKAMTCTPLLDACEPDGPHAVGHPQEERTVEEHVRR
jgi:hypothetical protein